jgi:hypothetical protein
VSLAPAAALTSGKNRLSFVKDLPPGSTYRTGSTRQPVPQPAAQAQPPQHSAGTGLRRGNRRRLFMITALLILSAVFAGLALFARGSTAWNQPAAAVGPPVTYIIDVQVDPPNLPPVTLPVLQSPQGSAFKPGTIVGTAPRKIALDRPGNWVFEGRFQELRSAPAAISIPEEKNRTVVIRIPVPDAAN